MCRSRATSAAILSSKPSPARLENGRLLGSAQTRKVPPCAPSAISKTSARLMRRMPVSEREHQQRAAAAGHRRQVAHCAGVAERAVADPGIYRGMAARPRPPADARQHREVLVAVLSLIGYRLADEARRRVEP